MAEYIEREALMRFISGDIQQFASFMDGADVYRYVCALINAAPTADVAPVVHGRWIDDGQCSACGAYDNADPFGSKFCSNCGAKMDGGEI